MKKLLSISLLFFLSLHLFAQSTQQKAAELMDAYVKLGKFNGSVLVGQKGKIVFQNGYGYKNETEKKKNDAQTIYQIGSVTKQFTSAIILQLQRENKLSVKDRISKFFPDFPRGNDITVENLLTHTSGIYNYTNDEGFMKNEITTPHTREQMMALFKDKPLNFEPGSKWDYSNSGYSLLGYIIEKVTGKSYETNLRERILQPLQMTSSGFDFANLKNENKAIGYSSIGEKPPPAPIVDSTVAYSAGALYSTVLDLYKWDRAISTNKILDQGDWKRAFTAFKNNYGYGWVIDSAFKKLRISHGGGIPGFTSILVRYPADETAIILLDNSGSSSLGDIAKNLAAVVFNLPYEIPKPQKEISVDSSILKQYIGEYQLAPNFSIIISFDGSRLKAQATGQPTVDIYAETETLFFLKVIEAKIEFIKDQNGSVTQIIFHQGGKDIPGKKIK
jgi:CubicO group peptidase (beta-lactamase class C family)